jgi:hypothetical protein
MLRATYRLAVLAVLVAAASWGYWYFHNPNSSAVVIDRLTREKAELEQVVGRLTEDRRVAEMVVTDQRRTPAGLETTLLFVEQARDGSSLPPKSVTVKGDLVYVDGLSIRFDKGFLTQPNGDLLRGHGIFLFTRAFGDLQTPESGPPIDDPGNIPDVYKPSPRTDIKQMAEIGQFERRLWGEFWRLVDDKQFRNQSGVSVASGKAVSFRPQPDRVYRISIDAGGSPTVDWEPMPPIYREAMKKPGVATTGPQ